MRSSPKPFVRPILGFLAFSLLATVGTSCVKPPERPILGSRTAADLYPEEGDVGEVGEVGDEGDLVQEGVPEVTPPQGTPALPTPMGPVATKPPVTPVVVPMPMPPPVTPKPMPMPTPTPAPVTPTPMTPVPAGLSTLLTEAQFNGMFPQRSPFYSYAGLVAAADATAGFAKEGSTETKKREIAALLANGQHESDQYKATREYNTANYDHYCDRGNTTYPCAANQQYYGRGPIQLSWNYNYGEAGKFIGVDLLNNPDLVATDSKIAWQTMMWFWMKSSKAGFTAHTSIVNETASSGGFGMTINVINGGIECGKGGKGVQEQVKSRIDYYNKILGILGVTAGPGRDDC